MAWTPLANRIKTLPRLLCGPILRKVTPTSATVWLALLDSATVTLTVRDDERRKRLEGAGKTIAVGTKLHIVAVTARVPSEGTALKEGVVYEYDLTFAFDDGAVQTLLGATPHARLAYPPFALPSFCLPPADVSGLRLMHGSCRLPHGKETDTLALLDDLIEQTASDARFRPHQLLLTGDQIYADDVAASMLVMLTDAAGTLLGWQESLPVPSARGGPRTPAQLSPFLRRGTLEVAGFTSVELDGHVMSLGEYLAMYLFVWSDVLWTTPVPSFAQIQKVIEANVDQNSFKLAIFSLRPSPLPQNTPEQFVRALGLPKKSIEKQIANLAMFQKAVPKVRRALANIPSYMVLDDHEVTDDWNMTRKTCRKMYGNDLGLRMVQNALVAYALCQHWGNAPEQFEDSTASTSTNVPPGRALLRLLDRTTAEDYGRQSDAICTLVGVHPSAELEKQPDKGLYHDAGSLLYHFTVECPGHQVVFTDTRTWRSFPAGAGGVSTMLPVDQLKAQILDTPPLGERVLLVVLTTNAPPVLPIRAATRHSRLAATFGGPSPDLYEAWEIGTAPFDRLLVTLSEKLPLVAGRRSGGIVLISGDVHFSFATRLVYSAHQRLGDRQPQPAAMVIAQLVGSSFRKQDEDTEGFHREGYRYAPTGVGPLIPKLVTEDYVGWNRRPGSGEIVGKRIQHVGRGTVPGGDVKLNHPTIRMSDDDEHVELSQLPEYRYRFDYAAPTRHGTVPAPPPPLPPLPAGTTSAERKAAAARFHKATGHYRDYSLHGGSKEKVVGVNNLSEIGFDRPPGSHQLVSHTARWIDPGDKKTVQLTTYVLSLDPADVIFSELPMAGNP